MKIVPLWLRCCVVGIVFVQGCANTRSFVETPSADRWQLAGKIAITYPDSRCNRDECPPRSDQGSVKWQQNKAVYDVSVFDPFARMVIQIHGDNEQLQAKVPGKLPIVATPDEFLQLIVGKSEDKQALAELSPRDLRYWLTGRPVPHMQHTNKSDQGFAQKGFVIGGEQWRDTAAGKMPSLVTIQKGQFRLRVVVRQWDGKFDQ